MIFNGRLPAMPKLADEVSSAGFFRVIAPAAADDEVSSAWLFCVWLWSPWWINRAMFDNLSDQLGSVFANAGAALLKRACAGDARRCGSLLEADVALPVVRRFIDQVTEAAASRC